MAEGTLGEIVFATVVEMTEERRTRDIVPEHPLLLPLRERLRSKGLPLTKLEVMRAVEELRIVGMVKVGRTINDNYIEIVGPR